MKRTLRWLTKIRSLRSWLFVPVATSPANLASAGIVRGIALPVAAIASSAQFSNSTSLSRATTRLFGFGASGVRLRSSTNARSE